MTDPNARYDRYADVFDNPVTAESVELGNRVLHWIFMENIDFSTGRLVVIDHARQAIGQHRWPTRS